MDPGTKELLSNHLAIVLGQCTPKVSRQDVLVNLLEEAVEVISVDKDLQGMSRATEWKEEGGGEDKAAAGCLCLMPFSMVFFYSPPCGTVGVGCPLNSGPVCSV